MPNTTTVSRLEQVRAAEVAMITEAFEKLRDAHVIPCSAYHPYIRVGRDYYGPNIMNGQAFRGFEETLNGIYPQRFDAMRPAFPRSFASEFAFSLLEAAVACIGLNDEDYDPTSATVEALIVALVEYLEAESSTVTCARLVGHLMTHDREELTFGEVRILRTVSVD